MHASQRDTKAAPKDDISHRSISLVLPAWNEEQVVVQAISEADTALSGLTDDYEIIVVDDGSTDSTADLVSSAAEHNPHLRLVRHQRNIGYGAAIRSGFQAATKDLIAFTDADCQFELSELDRFLLLSKDYDIVCGYRIDRKDSMLRCLYSRGYSQLVRLLLGTRVRDVDCALKLFRCEAIRDLEITTDGFLVNSELLTQAHQKGLTVVEVGVSHRPRSDGESTVSVAHIPKVFKGLVRYWWDTVQFPNRAFPPTSESTKRNRKLAWCQLGLLVIAAFFILTNLGYPLIDRDETRYAEIAREMLATGNWILPQLNFEPYYDKPPLLYWMCAISYSVFGVNEWSARLPPALAAIVTLASTMFFGNRWFGRRIGLYSGLVLMLSIGFIFCSRYLLIDGVLTTLVALSLMTAYEAIRGNQLKTGWWLASALFCGLAFLTKGPISLVLWLPPIYAIAWLSPSHARPNARHYAAFMCAVVAVACPWFVLVSLQDSRFLTEFFVTHNVRRFAGEFHTKPFWFFIPVLLAGGLPWSFLTLPLVRFMTGRGKAFRSQRPPALGFLVLWSVWCFAFFSLSKCKLPTYLLPAAPAFALMTGHFLSVVIHGTDNTTFRAARFLAAKAATATTCIVAIGFLVFGLSAQLHVSTSTYGWAVVWTAIGVGSMLLFREDRNRRSAWTTSAMVASLLGVMVMHQLVPAYSRSQTLLGDGSPVAKHFVQSRPVATVAHEFSEVPYYLGRSDIRHWAHSKAPGLDEFIQRHRESVLVVYKNVPIEQIQSRLPTGASAILLADHGPARVLRVRFNPNQARVAEQSPDLKAGVKNQ